MNFCKEKRRKLKQAFKIIYHQKSELAPTGLNDDLQADVMRRIRRLGPLKSGSNFLMLFERFVWHLAPVAMTITLFFAIVLMNFDLIPDSEIFQLLYHESDDFSMIQFLRF